MAREGPVTFDGYYYQLLCKGEDGVGQGGSLKSILKADNDTLIYIASISLNGIACSGEYAGGFFPVWMN